MKSLVTLARVYTHGNLINNLRVSFVLVLRINRYKTNQLII